MSFHKTTLAGGWNNLANPEGLDNDQVKETENYELLGNNVVTKRKDPFEYGIKTGSGTDLNEVLALIFTQTLAQISPPMYPIRKLSDMTGDFVMLAFGKTSGAPNTPELHLFYETATTWATELIEIDGIDYVADSYLEFSIGDDKIIITDTYDGSSVVPHYIKIDSDGELITGLFSIKSPNNKATMEPTTEYNSAEYEEDVDDVRLDECGIVQCAYTVVTKDGDESNPSPISNSKMMQFFKKDLVDKNDIRWIDNFKISNLSVPELTGDLREQLKYFYVYFRVIRYSEGEAAEPFHFSQRFEIVDYENTMGITGNGYLITIPQDQSVTISYENDLAPQAKHSAEISGIVGFSNVKEKIKFPFNFEKYCPISINNINNKNYVDAIVQIRIYDADNVGTLDKDGVQVDFIDDLDLQYFDLENTDYMKNLSKIRIYDSDLTTPIKVGYIAYRGGHYLDIYARIPLLVAGQLKLLYLCFNTSDGTEEGVTVSEYNTLNYGYFQPISIVNLSEFFDTERVKSNKTVICSPFDYMKGDEVINLADDNNGGEVIGEQGSFSGGTLGLGTKMLFNSTYFGIGHYHLVGSLLGGADFSEIKYSEMPYGNIPDRITFWGRIKYSNITGAYEKIIFLFNKESSDKGVYLSIIVHDGELRWALVASSDIRVSSHIKYIPFEQIDVIDDFNQELFICFSMDKGESVSLFVGNLLTTEFHYQKVDWSLWSEEPDDEYFTTQESFSIGYNNYTVGYSPIAFMFDISQFQMIINKYYDGSINADISTVWNIANFMTGFEAPLGTKIKE